MGMLEIARIRRWVSLGKFLGTIAICSILIWFAVNISKSLHRHQRCNVSCDIGTCGASRGIYDCL